MTDRHYLQTRANNVAIPNKFNCWLRCVVIIHSSTVLSSFPWHIVRNTSKLTWVQLKRRFFTHRTDVVRTSQPLQLRLGACQIACTFRRESNCRKSVVTRCSRTSHARAIDRNEGEVTLTNGPCRHAEAFRWRSCRV